MSPRSSPPADALAEQVVEAIIAVAGEHPGHRVAHAKGLLCAGTFTATPAARELCRAAHFAGDALDARVRFSNGSGDPTRPDFGRDGRGIAVKLTLEDGTRTDLLGITKPTFFVRTPGDFLEFTRLTKPEADTGQPNMERLGAWLGDHQETLPAIQHTLAEPPPAGYTTIRYFGLHAFRLTAPDGTERWVRFQWWPEGDEAFLDKDEAKGRGPDYLRDDLERRFADGPATLLLRAQVAQDGDPLDDPTAAWPDERELVDMGRLEVTGLAFDRDVGDDVLVFDPLRTIDGVEPSADPILHFRPRAYSASVARRMAARGL